MKMRVIIFVSILCSNIVRIATFWPQPGEFLGRYPIIEESPRFRSSFERKASPPPFLFSDSPLSDDFIVQPNPELEQLRRRVEMIDRSFPSLFNRSRSEPDRRSTSLPSSITYRIPESPPAFAQIPSRTSFRRVGELPPATFPRSSPPSFYSSNSYWNPIQCNCGLCAMRRNIASSNSNSNQNSGLFPWSNIAPTSRVEITSPSDESINPSTGPSVEPNQSNNSPDNQSNGSESAIDPPPATPSSPNSSTSSPPETPSQPENPDPSPAAPITPNSAASSAPDAPKQPENPSPNSDPPAEEISKEEDEKPSENESDDSKKPESVSQSESSDESPKKRLGGPDWEGPKTPEEDQPEYYSTEENVKFVRAFTSDMTRLGKYKVAQTIYYLLTQKGHELDEADRAALDYVINERLKKDPEVIEALKKYNEKHKGENKTKPSPSNNGPPSNQEMPPYMPEMLSSSNYSSEFPIPSENENNPNSNSNFRRNSGTSGPAPSYTYQQPSPLRFRAPPPSGTISVPDNVRRLFEEIGQDPPSFIPLYQTSGSAQSSSVPYNPFRPRVTPAVEDSPYSPYSANIRRVFEGNNEDRSRFIPSLRISRSDPFPSMPSRRWGTALRFPSQSVNID